VSDRDQRIPADRNASVSSEIIQSNGEKAVTTI
jgi:hypothetical protein